MYPSPYSPPAAAYQPHGAGYHDGPPEIAVPLGWRTTVGSIGIAMAAFMSFVVDGVSVAFGNELKAADPGLAPALITVAAGLGLILANLLAAIFFLIWMHRAAKNLIGLGRRRMVFTPGWCVGWFFVPFANLVKPVQAMNEIWRGSDPEAQDGYWQHGPTSALLPLWWGTWLLGNVFGNVSARLDDATASGLVGLIGSVLSAVAAVTLITLMHKIASRQLAAASHAAGSPPAQPGYGSAYPVSY